MILLNAENISKTYVEKKILDDVSFGIMEGDRIGLIGINGTGKTTLLKILAGIEEANEGRVILTNNVNIEYLPQNPDFEEDRRIIEQVFKGNSKNMKILRAYEEALLDKDTPKERIIELSQQMDAINGWELENEAKNILTKLGVYDFNAKIGKLSGGQKKRVALASALINESELLILDEPTNHLDSETIVWLEEYLAKRKGALIMVTHDRYFLDRCTNKIFEIDRGNIYSYEGNFSYFLQAKLEREEMEAATEAKKYNLYRKELAWMKQGAKARSTKQKARIQRFEELEGSFKNLNEEDLEISVASSRLGKKIIEINKISKSIGDKKLIEDFSYTVLRDDRVGILGPNGVGKTTLLKIIVGKVLPDRGTIEIGETVKLGVFSQETSSLDDEQRAIEYIKDGGEFISTSDGTKISASQMMENFLFSSELQWTPIGKLSGGEKRRLQLLRTLIEAPNVLILDEPTNDLDIQTLSILEDYIENFPGAVMIVSHDRYLLDKIVEKVFVFEEDGQIEQYTGNYSYFMDNIKEEEKKTSVKKERKRESNETVRFSYNEKREWEAIDEEIEDLEVRIQELMEKMEEAASDYTLLEEYLKEKEDLEAKLEEKMERWLYLSEKEEMIKNQ